MQEVYCYHMGKNEMLDYWTASAAFFLVMFGIQEWVLRFHLGYLGRYWAMMSAASLFLGFLLSGLVCVPLIINLKVDPSGHEPG
ncbi:hypothetical protein GS682_18210 [Nostoc sp. B(2019)]|nr:hypothetical protein [Nostoc sp. B(2019)]